MKKALFIVPYFGSLPNTFIIFLRTCAHNPDFDWLIITDDKTAYNYPSNVHVTYSSFQDFVARIQQHFDFPIALKHPYKICDFRPAFGVIFAEELKEYKFWGHCDLDQYFGNINHFITDEILDSHDKILCLGHFTLFRNIPAINRMYLVADKQFNQGYQDAFSQEKHWIFDEWPSGNTSINKIVKQEGVKTYYCHDCFCDLIPFASRYRRYIFDENQENWKKESIKNTVFLWEEGKLFLCFNHSGAIKQQEVMYVHIRQRKLLLNRYNPSFDNFCIVPNEIISTANPNCSLIQKMLRNANVRSCFFPDEFRRKKVIATTYIYAGIRRIKRFLKG